MSIKKSFIVLKRFIIDRFILKVVRKRNNVSIKKKEMKFKYFDKLDIKKYYD